MHDGLEVVGRAIVGDHRAVHTGGEVSLGLGHSTGIASGGGLGVLCGPGGSKHIYLSTELIPVALLLFPPPPVVV